MLISIPPTVSSGLELPPPNYNDTASAHDTLNPVFALTQRWTNKRVILQFYIHQQWQQAQEVLCYLYFYTYTDQLTHIVEGGIN